MQFLGFVIVLVGFPVATFGALVQSGKTQVVACLAICLGLLMCIFG